MAKMGPPGFEPGTFAVSELDEADLDVQTRLDDGPCVARPEPAFYP